MYNTYIYIPVYIWAWVWPMAFHVTGFGQCFSWCHEPLKESEIPEQQISLVTKLHTRGIDTFPDPDSHRKNLRHLQMISCNIICLSIQV